MNKFLYTTLDPNRWETSLQWVRSHKQKDIQLIVVDSELQDYQKNKLEELDVRVLPLIKDINPHVDVHRSLSPWQLKNPGRYLFLEQGVQSDIAGLWEGERFTTTTMTKIDVSSLVFPFSSFDSRVRFAAKFENEIVPKHQGVLFGGMICANVEEWRTYTGFFSNLFETGVIENSGRPQNLAVNLFAFYFPHCVAVNPTPYALQSENLK